MNFKNFNMSINSMRRYPKIFSVKTLFSNFGGIFENSFFTGNRTVFALNLFIELLFKHIQQYIIISFIIVQLV